MSELKYFTDDTADEGLAARRDRSHLRIFFPAFTPSSYCQHGLQVRIFVFQSDKLCIASVIDVSLLTGF
jgi:hypothetical protein